MAKSKVGKRNALFQAIIGGTVLLMGFLLFIFKLSPVAVPFVLVIIGGSTMSQGIRNIRKSNNSII